MQYSRHNMSRTSGAYLVLNDFEDLSLYVTNVGKRDSRFPKETLLALFAAPCEMFSNINHSHVITGFDRGVPLCVFFTSCEASNSIAG